MRPAGVLVGVLSLAAAGCGYQAAYPRELGDARLHVHLARTVVGSALAADEVLSGVREELARNAALAGGEGYPRVAIEVLSEGEASEGIAAAPSGANGAPVPRARATQVSLLARAWIESSAGAAPSRDTGDLHAADVVASGPPAGSGGPGAGHFDASREVFLHEEATLALARRLGVRLAQQVLLEPAVVGEGTGRER